MYKRSGAGGNGDDDDHRHDEWEQCLAMTNGFEDKLDGLRKYGFTFVAGLLSTRTCMWARAPSPTSGAPPPVRGTVFLLGVAVTWGNPPLVIVAVVVAAVLIWKIEGG